MLKLKTRNGVSYGIWFSRNVTSSKRKGVPGRQQGEVTKQHHLVRISWSTGPQHLDHCCIVRTEIHSLCRPLMIPQGSCQNNRKDFFVGQWIRASVMETISLRTSLYLKQPCIQWSQQRHRRHEYLEWEPNEETTETCTCSMTGRIQATTTNPNEMLY